MRRTARHSRSNPDSAATRALLADLVYRGGNTEEALKLVRDGIARNAKAAGLQRDLGSLLERAGRTDEAVAAYREYARLAPQASDASKIAERAEMLSRARRSRRTDP